MKLVSILLIISKFSATIFAHDKLDMIQSAIDNYFASKNSSQSIKLPRFTLTTEDSSCVIATADLLRQALNFLGQCKLGDKDLDCLNPNWAVRLLDSYPIKPAALARRGPLYLLSDFETCRQLFRPHSAHYCLARGAVRPSQNLSAIPITVGMCLPQACEPATLRRIVRGRVELDELWCQNGLDDEWTARKTWVFCVIFGIFAVLMIATLMEKLKAKGLIEMKKLHDNVDDNRSDTTSIVGGVSGGAAPSIALTYRNFQHIAATTRALPMDIVTAFAVQTSVAHLFRNATRECRLINGMRVWTSFWVIFSHTCLFWLQFTDTIREILRESAHHRLTTAFMLNSSLAVDTFLFISGCSAAFSFRRKVQFRGQSARVSAFRAATMCLHRLLRYWPGLAVYLGFVAYVYTHLSDGPFWNTSGMFGSQCATQWSLVSHFLFASNVWPSQCVPWLWHVSLDFQLHLILPLCLVVLAKLSWRRATAAILSLVAICLTYRVVAYTKLDVPANIFVEMLSQGDTTSRVARAYRLMYTMPVSRAPPFLIGTLTGWMILSPPRRVNSTLVAVALQLVAIVALVASLFGNVDNAIHVVAHRTAWATGLAIFVALANCGHAKWLTYVLGSHRYTPLSRLSFGVFLAHEPFLLAYLNSMHQPISNFSIGFLFCLSLAVYALSLVVAWLIAIVIEIPLITLERRVLMRPASSSRMRAAPRRVSFNDDGDTIYGDDDDNEIGGEDNGDADNERDETRIELGNHPEMTFDEKTQNWLQNGGQRLIAAADDQQPEQEHTTPPPNESTC